MQIKGKKSEDEANEHAAKAHQLMNASNAQISNYVDNNITDVTSVNELLKEMLILQKAIIKRLV